MSLNTIVMKIDLTKIDSIPFKKIRSKNWGIAFRILTAKKNCKILVQSVKHLFKAVQPNDCVMHMSYWLEQSPISFKGSELHAYPDTRLMDLWLKSKIDNSYRNFLINQLLAKTVSLEIANTKYFSTVELSTLQVSINREIFYQNGEILKNGKYIFVLTKDDKFYFVKKRKDELGRIQHSSLSSGRPIRSAGKVTIDTGGKLVALNNISGHYRPKSPQIINIVNYLANNNISLNSFQVEERAFNFVVNVYRADAWIFVNHTCKLMLPYSPF